MNDNRATERIEDDHIARLLNLAGERPPIPSDLEARVYATVEREWRGASVRRQLVRWAVPVTLAAALVIAMTVLITSRNAPPPSIGTVARLVGGEQSDAAGMMLGQVIRSGQTVRTAAGQSIGVVLHHGPSLRIAESTILRLDAENALTLERGLIYADSGPSANDGRAMTVRTSLGSITDVGTQFAVDYGKNRIAVAVREGRVDVAGQDASYAVAAGQKMSLLADGRTESVRVSASDESWNWAVALAPDFVMEGKSLLDFLEWAARETGKELVMATDEARNEASLTVLHGSVSGFAPLEAIHSVLPTTSFDYRIDDTRLYIGK